MDDKKMQQLAEAEEAVEVVEEEAVAEEAVAEEPVLSEEDALKANVEALREELRIVEDKVKVLSQKLNLAKGKGMIEQANTCRELLQKLVVQANEKKEAIKEAEALYREAKKQREIAELNAEIDALTAEIVGDYFTEEEEPLEEPVFVAEYDHAAKAKRLSVVSKAFAFVGIFTAFICALVYMLCVEFTLVPFNWLDLVVFAAVAVVFIIIGLCIGGASNKHKRIAAEIELEIAEKRAQYEAEVAERERLAKEKAEAWKVQNMDAVAEAYAIEQQTGVEMAKAAKKEDMKNRMIVGLSEVPEKIKEHKKTIIPVAVAATAVVAAAALVSSGKKKAAAKRSAAARKELIDSIIKSI